MKIESRTVDERTYFAPNMFVALVLLVALSVLTPAMPAAASDWHHYGGGLSGTRYTTAEQITAANVQELQVAWQFRTGEDPYHEPDPQNLPSFEGTPLKIGESLYLCTPRNQIIAIDATTGKERWRYDPHTVVAGTFLLACRGVAYYQAPVAKDQCSRRILAGTLDGRLFALDADTGKPCDDFGVMGTVSLLDGLGAVEHGFYGVTSPPIVVNGTVVVGSLVLDDQSVDVPSGVVRAFDAITGKQLWAFDAGRDDTNPVLRPAETYTRGSPNAWGVYSADPALGLVYIPTGNNSPDYFGANRSPAAEKYASSVVALDVATGAVRWVFQTVHHDLWDYDVPAQPVLADIDTDHGKVPALIQSTKRGELFVLDRRSGTPLSRVEERAVPGGAADGDRVAPTQPFSVEMPSLMPPPLTEASMWGLTPFDLLWCRTKFKQYRYDGAFTPPSVQGSIHYPNNMGATNWGGVSIDEDNQILVANTTNVPSIVQLVPRDQVAKLEASGVHIYNPQLGTPYAALQTPFLSPLGIPCNAPPWGLLTAIDLRTKKVLWQKPLGTTRDRSPLPFGLTLGMPNIGGSLLTRSGLTFIGAAVDNYLRAFDTQTGALLWETRLPASAQATPMSYIDETSGRQYIVVSVGGHKHLGSKMGDYVIAFALPETAHREDAAVQ